MNPSVYKRLNKWDVCGTEYYSAREMNKVLAQDSACMKLEAIPGGESQSQESLLGHPICVGSGVQADMPRE